METLSPSFLPIPVPAEMSLCHREVCPCVCVILYKNGDKLLHVTLYRGKSFSKARIIHSGQKVEATQLSIDK